MMKFAFLVLVLSVSASAYVPTVESLFRHGGNPDMVGNALTMNLTIKKLQPGTATQSVNDVSLLKDDKVEDFYRIYLSKNSHESMKVGQVRFSSGQFSDGALIQRAYFPNFTAFTMKPTIEQTEKGLFFAFLHSVTMNNGTHLVTYLKSLGVPVRLNNEIINREKIEYLAEYKRYLIAISKDRGARKTAVNPLRPEDPAARDKVESVMDGSMYSDMKQVKLTREDGDMAWLVSAGAFEAVVSYRDRNLLRMKFKSAAGDFEVQCRDYWLANGTHLVPKFLVVKTFSGESYQVEISGFRHYTEREDELVKRVNHWDKILKSKESSDPRPAFML